MYRSHGVSGAQPAHDITASRLTDGQLQPLGLISGQASELYEVSPTDPLTFTMVTIVLSVVALIAA